MIAPKEKKATKDKKDASKDKKVKVQKRSTRRYGKQKCARLRKSITPGTVVILLAGPHKGKRVVFLKQLNKSGLLLVTGPFKYNGCPLRRVNQRMVIATRTKLDISGINLSDKLNDAFFKRAKVPRTKKTENRKELFAQEKEAYKLSTERQSAQKEVDSQILKSLKAKKDPFMAGYLSSKFGLFRKDLPHKMQF